PEEAGGSHNSEKAAEDLDKLPMRVGLGQFSELTDERMAFVKQCGVEDIVLNTPKLPGEKRWGYEDLLALNTRAREAGLRLVSIENVPISFYDKIMLGLPGRHAQLENMRHTVQNIGRAGIPILGYHFMPNSVWRTSPRTVRGGAVATAFALKEAQTRPLSFGRRYGEDEMWDNYDWYLERILPVCEEAGVRLALHPDDPPVAELGGVARLFWSFENFKRAMEVHNSPMHGFDFCHGCWSEMRGGAGVLEAIRFFGEQGRIFYVHMRDVQGTADDFTECWLGEGNCNILKTMRTLKEVGFRGIMLTDHVPHMPGDTPWGHRGRAYTVGYMKALLQVLESQPA
ncbi:MAG: mannonate dehydratase, partial [Planctomycetota bacterium]